MKSNLICFNCHQYKIIETKSNYGYFCYCSNCGNKFETSSQQKYNKNFINKKEKGFIIYP